MRKIVGTVVGLMMIVVFPLSVMFAATGTSVLSSVLVVENGRPIGSLSSPGIGEELHVQATRGDNQLQAFLQLRVIPGERTLVLSEMDGLVVSALAEGGVVGKRLQGGWNLVSGNPQDVHVTVTGKAPPESAVFDLVEVVKVTGEEINTQARVVATVHAPQRSIPLLTILGSAAGLLLLGGGFSVWLWMRFRALQRRT